MGVYIKDMEMPTVEDEFVEVSIFGDGKVIQTGKSWRCKEDGKCYYEPITPELFYHATEIPEPHGRLIDADALNYTMLYKENWMRGTGVEASAVWKKDIDAAKTIIPAEEGE